MLTWKIATIAAVALIAGGMLYIRLRWHRAPQAYRAMTAVAGCFFVAGLVTGAVAYRLFANSPNIAPVAPVAVASTTAPLAPTLDSLPSVPFAAIPSLHFDPAHAVLPDSNLTLDSVSSVSRYAPLRAKTSLFGLRSGTIQKIL